MRKSYIALCVVAALAFACANTSAMFAAGVVSVPFVPAGLSPGDTYQVAFVTDSVTDAVSTSLSTYDAFVESEAVEPGAITVNWGIGWSPIVATFEEPYAILNAGIAAPVYLLDGDLLANDSADFWDGELGAPFGVDQYGKTVTEEWVWSGFDSTGGRLVACETNPLHQCAQVSINFWGSVRFAPTTDVARVFAVSEVLTVVPEPTTISTCLMLTGLGAISGFSRRKRDRPTVASQV